MKQFKRTAVSICCLVLLVSCTDFSGKRAPKSANGAAPPDLEIKKDFRSVAYSGSEKRWEALATNARVYQNQKITELTHVRINLFDGAKITAHIEAEKAYLNSVNDSVDLVSNVVLHSTNNTRLHTQRITWDNRRNKLVTTNRVWISRNNGDWISGIGMEADLALDNIVIYKEVDQGKTYGPVSR
ncbi:MAG: LPS export ABC transporter periplasmic protein LptC [Spirochaetes bacterium]|nr:LPS export ABC transporter periplasmic protein LptC [Spirochaetota bacterium]